MKTRIMNLYNIKISKEFLKSNVSDKKIEKAKDYIKKHKKIDKPIVVNNNGVLMDNYTRLIAAYLMGLHEVPCVEVLKLD